MKKKDSICFQKADDGKFYMPTSLVKIQKEYQPALDEVIAFFNKLDDKNIHSVYLRGSIVFGSGIKDFSDLDFFVISLKPLTDFDRLLIKKHMDEVNKNYPFITRFDFGYFTLDQILTMRENVLIKLSSICIYGTDIKDQIKSPKPGKDITISLSLIEDEMKKTRKEIKLGLYDKSNTEAMCVWIMKRIVRSGLELVSEREGCFTRDLGECFKRFTKYYPNKKDYMEKALILAIKPTTDTKTIENVFDTIGDWLVVEGKRLGLIS